MTMEQRIKEGKALEALMVAIPEFSNYLISNEVIQGVEVSAKTNRVLYVEFPNGYLKHVSGYNENNEVARQYVLVVNGVPISAFTVAY